MTYIGSIALTACQVRMARAALRWSIEELARRSDVSEKTIRRIEKVFGIPPNVTVDTLAKLQSCFEREGLTLIPEYGGPEGPGVRYGTYPGRVVHADRPRPSNLAAELAAGGALERLARRARRGGRGSARAGARPAPSRRSRPLCASLPPSPGLPYSRSTAVRAASWLVTAGGDEPWRMERAYRRPRPCSAG